MFERNGHLFFTPASTIKILTLFAALSYLPDKVPAAYYTVRGDTLLLWGGGDPGAYYPDISGYSALDSFISSHQGNVLFSNQHFLTTRFGSGWAWDDFPYGFQSERTAYPIYGNRLWIERNRDTIHVTPAYFKPVVSVKKDTITRLTRNEWGSMFEFRYDARQIKNSASVPVSLLENDIKGIWREVSGKAIFFSPEAFDRNASVLNGSTRDPLLKIMMRESDNFIAEQLLLGCSMIQSGNMQEGKFIRHILSHELKGLPDTLVWVDGSGLSRYNKLTPLNVVDVLRRIINRKGIDYIKNIFPAGGTSGTLVHVFHPGDGEAYLYAKSGSMRNVYCISGVLFTRSGHTLVFSWMNDDIRISSKQLIVSIEVFLTLLRDRY